LGGSGESPADNVGTATGSVGNVGIVGTVSLASELSMADFFEADSEPSLSFFEPVSLSPLPDSRLAICTGLDSAPVTAFNRAEKGDRALVADPADRSEGEEVVVDFDTIRTPE